MFVGSFHSPILRSTKYKRIKSINPFYFPFDLLNAKERIKSINLFHSQFNNKSFASFNLI